MGPPASNLTTDNIKSNLVSTIISMSNTINYGFNIILHDSKVLKAVKKIILQQNYVFPKRYFQPCFCNIVATLPDLCPAP